MKRTTKLKRARISFVSFVPKGANKLPGLYKSDTTKEAELSFGSLIKDDIFEEQGKLLALVYAPDMVDSQGHFADKEAILEMSETFMEEGAKLDIRHDRRELKKDQAFCTQCFIVQKGDPRFADTKDYDGKPVNTEGAWALEIKIVDEQLKKLYREEGWSGLSLYSYPGDYEIEPGDITLEEEEIDMDETKFAALLKSALEEKFPTQKKETQLSKEEIQTMVLEALGLKKQEPTIVDMLKEALGVKTEKVETSIADSLRKALGLEDKPTEKKVGAFDIKALRAKKLQKDIETLANEYDLDDPDQIEEFLEAKKELEIAASEKTKAKKSVAKGDGLTFGFNAADDYQAHVEFGDMIAKVANGEKVESK